MPVPSYFNSSEEFANFRGHLLAVSCWRHLLIAILAATLLSSMAVAALPTREPDRYALVIGNGSYNAYGAMGDLLTACDEAVKFRARLIGLGWDRSRIFPLVVTAAPQETDLEVRKSICDLKTGQLDGELKKFSSKMIRMNNPYGVVYFSGHGAQSDGHQYIFGVDADVDFHNELQLAEKAPNYKVFGDSGVDVIDIISRVSGSDGRAMLVIIDACRDNPVLKKYSEDLKNAQATSNDAGLVERLSAGYLSPDAQSKDITADFSNVIVLFSTRPQREAAGASPGTTTQFFSFVMDQLSDEKALEGNAPAFVNAVISEARIKQKGLAAYDRQIPDLLGSMAASPTYCFRGCPQPIDAWPSSTVKIIGNGPTPLGNVAQSIRKAGRAPFVSRNPLLRSVSYVTQSPIADQPAKGASAPLAPPPRAIKIDLFYCQGDDLAEKRKADATAYGEALYSAYPPSKLIGRYYLDPIRVLSFDPVAKPALALGKNGVTIWVDNDSTLEMGWAKRLAEIKSGLVIKENRRTITKEYISVFFCSDRSKTATPVSSVYTQVSLKQDVAKGNELITLLGAEVPGVTFISPADPVDEPKKSQPTIGSNTHRLPTVSTVKFYTEDQRRSADAIVNSLKNQLAYAAIAELVPSQRPPKNPIIEIWIGQREIELWRSQSHSASP
jgi:hypothetical protein